MEALNIFRWCYRLKQQHVITRVSTRKEIIFIVTGKNNTFIKVDYIETLRKFAAQTNNQPLQNQT